MMDYVDYYQELGLSKGASKEEIHKQYKKLARQWHPDVNKSPGAEEKFKRVVEAYEVLKDPDKRKKYDRYGSAWKSAGQGRGPSPGFEGVEFDFGGQGQRGPGQSPFGASGFSSFFESLFGSDGFRAGGTGAPFGADLGGQHGTHHEATVELSLEDAAQGGKRRVRLVDPDTGKERSFEVEVPAGVKPGQKIRLKGQGGKAKRPGGKAGDLFLVIDIAKHPRLRLEGSDLYTSLPITPWLAALGGEAKLQTLTGSVSVSVPPGASSGQKIRLKAKGYPKGKEEHGDLYAEIKIVVPKRLSDEERKLFEQLREVSKFEPE